MQPSGLPTSGRGLPGKEAAVCAPCFCTRDPRPLLQSTKSEQVAYLDPLQGPCFLEGPKARASFSGSEAQSSAPGLLGSQAPGV